MIADDKINEVRQAARISEFISPHVALKRRGRNLMGVCPFHDEKTPSFSVNDEHGFFHCFGCGVGGNVFKFLMMAEGLSFPEAVRKVADRYGITVPDSAGDGSSAASREKYDSANKSAAEYFRRCLLETPAGKPVLEYLERRGVHAETAEAYMLGAAPASGSGLLRWFERRQVPDALGRELGLLVSRGGGLQDRYRNRLVFPIRDLQGRVIGFAARAIDAGDGPKYLNSPESPVYRKSRILYGLHEAREALHSTQVLLLVEGYLDAIALHQSGIANVAATCGTALTTEQARLIRRQADEAVIVFDGDSAGRAAAARSFPVFVEAGLWPKTVVLPGGEDPDSFVAGRGREAFEELVATAEPLVEAFVERVASQAEAGASGSARAGAALAEVLARIDNPFERDVLLRKAALWTGISEDVLRREAARKRRAQAATPAPAAPRGGAAGPEELLITAMLSSEDAVRRVDQSGVMNSLVSPVWKPVATDMIERVRTGLNVDPGAALETIPEEYRRRVAARLGEGGGFEDAAMRARIIEDCIKGVEKLARRRHNESLLLDLRKREQLGADLEPAEDLAKWKPRNRSDA